MKRYRCKQHVEAARWHDTDENRELFAAWFDEHDAMFETRGPVVALPEGGEVVEGEWIVRIDSDFVAMEHEQFTAGYAEVGS